MSLERNIKKQLDISEKGFNSRMDKSLAKSTKYLSDGIKRRVENNPFVKKYKAKLAASKAMYGTK